MCAAEGTIWPVSGPLCRRSDRSPATYKTCGMSHKVISSQPTTTSSAPKPVLRSQNYRARPRHDVRGTHTMAGAHPAAVGGRSMPHVPMPRLYTAQEPATAAGDESHFSTKVAG